MNAKIELSFESGKTKDKRIIGTLNTDNPEIEGLFIHKLFLPIQDNYSLELFINDKTIVSTNTKNPFDVNNPLDLIGDNLDWLKFFHPVTKLLLPDVKTHYDLWYKFYINGVGLLHYQLHYGPTYQQGNRAKFEGNLVIT